MSRLGEAELLIGPPRIAVAELATTAAAFTKYLATDSLLTMPVRETRIDSMFC